MTSYYINPAWRLSACSKLRCYWLPGPFHSSLQPVFNFKLSASLFLLTNVSKSLCWVQVKLIWLANQQSESVGGSVGTVGRRHLWLWKGSTFLRSFSADEAHFLLSPVKTTLVLCLVLELMLQWQLWPIARKSLLRSSYVNFSLCTFFHHTFTLQSTLHYHSSTKYIANSSFFSNDLLWLIPLI